MKNLILKVFECKHCKGKFVIVKANNTVIPVNVKGDEEYAIDTIYERAVMETHLKGGSGRREDWQEGKNKYLAVPELRYAEKEVTEHIKVEQEGTFQANDDDMIREKKIKFEKILQSELKEKGLI